MPFHMDFRDGAIYAKTVIIYRETFIYRNVDIWSENMLRLFGVAILMLIWQVIQNSKGDFAVLGKYDYLCDCDS